MSYDIIIAVSGIASN